MRHHVSTVFVSVSMCILALHCCSQSFALYRKRFQPSCWASMVQNWIDKRIGADSLSDKVRLFVHQLHQAETPILILLILCLCFCPIDASAFCHTQKQGQIFCRFHITRHARKIFTECYFVCVRVHCLILFVPSTTGWLHHCKSKRQFPKAVHVWRLSFAIRFTLWWTGTSANAVLGEYM